jgi:TetR/AcrR family transcriptional regulator
MDTFRRRARGRPQMGSKDHREALIDAARDQFAAQGVGGSSLSQIARRAQVTPALAHYYFSDKQGLLEAVLRERVQPLVGKLRSEVESRNNDPAAAIACFVQRYTATAARNPWLPQLLVREVLSGGGALRGAFQSSIAQPMTSFLRTLVSRGQQSGAIRSDLAAERIVLSLMSLCLFPFIAKDSVSAALGLDMSPAGAPALTLHTLAVLQNGLRSSS